MQRGNPACKPYRMADVSSESVQIIVAHTSLSFGNLATHKITTYYTYSLFADKLDPSMTVPTVTLDPQGKSQNKLLDSHVKW